MAIQHRIFAIRHLGDGKAKKTGSPDGFDGSETPSPKKRGRKRRAELEDGEQSTEVGTESPRTHASG